MTMKQKTISLSIVLLVSLTLVLSSCKSDYEKYREIMREAAESPITELATPDGLNFNMDENEYNSYIDSIPQKEIDYSIYWPLHFEDAVYAAGFSKSEFYEGKLCKYDFWIDYKIANDTLVDLLPDDIKKIVEHYKTALGEGCELAILPERLITADTYLLTKGNLAITITRSHSVGKLRIECENRPASINVKEETRDYGSSYTPTVTVKNNKWNGGVKQVEDYLERTLRDPDSYESIEWSEVKQKDDGFYVRHKYKAKNGFGGYVVTNQLFHLDFSGNVVDVKDLY